VKRPGTREPSVPDEGRSRLSYRVETTTRVGRDLAELHPDVAKAIGARIEALKENPRPRGAKVLRADLGGCYRLTVRKDYRIGYDVDDKTRTVTVWQVGHRSRFYERGKRRRK
jgi:mRNA-degrading endonuclease RelE of RelBE toxin-antitoxin system